MIAIVDYDAGNIRSVLNALGRVGASDFVLTADREQLRNASHVILPGVGEASCAMQALREAGLADFIPTLGQPVLGICVGAQLMCAGSEEGDTRCMGIFPAEVRRFRETPSEKVPHMGWNSLREPGLSSRAQSGDLSSPLFACLKEGEYVYFVHSYYPELCADTIAVANHGIDFSAALSHNNFYACQFHPEKSGAVGERILKNFLAL
ncbi:MAG: imidazole glycerol phosphate synthase subunit HisH [Bacteroidales bacterium]|nr:imidazole glycerol phosphate synthase subunit HisH [Bacteroidales bacterium]MBQ9530035.1 imidazole glycerol phosphate synthase subunit HisH [Bacteroidales bacterium]